MEEWRAVPGWPEYEVSSEGRVRSVRVRVLDPYIAPNGYRMVSLAKGGRSKGALLHRLILAAFTGPCPPGMEGRHLDGDQRNNRPDNLAWGTRIENKADQRKHGTDAWYGERHYNAKLSVFKVRCIRALLAQGAKLATLGRLFGVGKTTISAIKNRKIWRGVEA